MTVKFKRYKVRHNRKDYYIFVPELIKDNLWINTLNDDWWGGPFLTGSVRAMRILSVCFALLGFNPYAILYLPIKDNKIPEGMSGNPENGHYDVVFRTNRVQLKDTDWKQIRAKMRKSKWTTYKFRFDEERFRNYFKKDIDFLDNVDPDKILEKGGADMWLSCGTVFCSYPRSIYRRCSIRTWDYIKEGLEGGNIGGYYEKKFDYWTADMIGSVTGWTTYGRKKSSYEKPGVMLNLEIYDLHIANRKLKRKEKLVKLNRDKLEPRQCLGVNMFKITIGG